MKGEAYEKYTKLMRKARAQGFGLMAIMIELENEKQHIIEARDNKLLELSFERSPYPARECRRAANECLTAIERILKELQNEKEMCI